MVFCFSTIFIVVFSVKAIYFWPPLVKHASILGACVLPAGMVALGQAPVWLQTRKVPKEVLWVLTILVLGLISTTLSTSRWATLKSTTLFLFSGPFVFIISRHLFESKPRRDLFLWMASLGMLSLAIFGMYEHIYLLTHSWAIGIQLLSRNPLPGGTLLMLLSAFPLILLGQTRSPYIKFLLIVTLLLSALILILLIKKTHIFSLIIIFLSLIILIGRNCLKYCLGFIVVMAVVFYFSDATRIRYEGMLGFKVPEILLANPETNNAPHKPKQSGDQVTPNASGSDTVELNSNQAGLEDSVTDTENRSRTDADGESAPQTYESPAENIAVTGSFSIRLENYFFALSIFKEHPVWGIGFKADLSPYLDQYEMHFPERLSKEHYTNFINLHKTFENIILAFTVEMGALFTVTYFSGMLYIIFLSMKDLYNAPQRNFPKLIIASILVGFVFSSMTYDTLRYPNLNWIFHSMLGFLASLPRSPDLDSHAKSDTNN